jgi:3-hydroxyisobutyrate dehydrogenase-like beta-hydroxyacid dehydrogenase
MDIGFIGLGNMGAHMARRLLEAGHKVVVYDTRQEAIGDLAALGAIAARSPAEVADAAETVWQACRRRTWCSMSRPVRAV